MVLLRRQRISDELVSKNWVPRSKPNVCLPNLCLWVLCLSLALILRTCFFLAESVSFA